jgi:hypothetical protein
MLYFDVENKWKNYHITTFLDSLSPKTLSLEGAMDLSRDRNEMNGQMDYVEEYPFRMIHAAVAKGISNTMEKH